MSARHNRHPRNVPGRFYVDDMCLCRGTCIQDAPEHFGMDVADATAYVKKQPETPEEIARCMKAMKGCPVGAIGCDGDGSAGTSETATTPSPDASAPGKKPWWRFW